MTLNDFYADRFGSDPFSLIEAARDELTELAQMAGINWSACSDNIQLNPRGGVERYSSYNKTSPEALEKSLKGRVEIYSRLEHSKGIDYPFINFVHKGSDAGSWSGFSFLFSEYRREQQRNNATVVAQPEEERARIEREARRRREEQWTMNVCWDGWHSTVLGNMLLQKTAHGHMRLKKVFVTFLIRVMCVA